MTPSVRDIRDLFVRVARQARPIGLIAGAVLIGPLPAQAQVASSPGKGGGFTGSGLVGQYYSNVNFSGTPVFSRNDDRLNFIWKTGQTNGISGSASLPLPTTNFSVKWTGQIIPKYSETYTFSTVSDDGVKVIVNGQTLINNLTYHAPTTNTGSITLQAGQTYSIEVDYFQGGGGAQMQLFWQSPSTPRSIIEPASGIGVNMVSDHLFTDVIHTARSHWDTAAHLGDGAAPEDANGWPTSDASLVVWEGVSSNNGTYGLRFNGQAAIGVAYGYGIITNQVYNAGSNTTTATLTVTDTGYENFSLIFTNTHRVAGDAGNTGLTNLQVMRPTSPGASAAYPFTAIFTTEAKALTAKFSTLRFMDETNTNGTTQTNWSDRNLPGAHIQGLLAWEYVVQYCNETGKDPYINIPMEATDAYITSLANLFKYGSDGVNPYTSPQARPVYSPLNPGLNVYIEYSNEVWNAFFPQWEQNKKAAIAEVVNSNFTSPLYEGEGTTYSGTDNEGDPAYNGRYLWAERRVAERIKATSDIFRSVFGDAAMPGTSVNPTIRPVLEFQYANANDTASGRLSFLDDAYNNADGQNHTSTPHPPSYYLWGAGGASYYGSGNDAATTVDALFASGLPFGYPATNTYYSLISTEADWAKAYGLNDIAYEGGWAVADPNNNGYNNPPNSVAENAKFDPRATAAEVNSEMILSQAGGDLNIFYTAAAEGDPAYIWGMTDSIFNLTEPLYLAINQINATLPAAPTNGAVVPATLPTSAATLSLGLSGGTLSVGGWASWNILVPAIGPYNVSTDAAAGGTQQIWADGTLLGTEASASAVTAPPFGVTLTPGLHTVRVACVGGAFGLGSVFVNAGPPPATGPALEVFEFAGKTGHEATDPPTGLAPGVTGSVITRGPGLAPEGQGLPQAAGSFASGSASAVYPQTAAQALATGQNYSNEYYQFALTSPSGQGMSLKTIQFAPWGQNETPSALVQYSTDGTNFSTAGTGSSGLDSLDLSSIPALQGVSGTVTFRVYLYAIGSYESSGIGYHSGNDITVYGSVGQGASAITVPNFGFETPNQNGGYTYNPSGGSWTFDTSSGLQGNGSAWGAAPAPEGVQTAFVQGVGTISQSLSGFLNGSGIVYALTVSAAQRGSYNSGGQSVDVYLDTTKVGTITPSGTSFTDYQITGLMPSAGSHTLKFVGTNPYGGDNTAFLDNVRLTDPPSAPVGVAPASPAGVTATAGAVGSKTITVKWKASAGVVTSYQVYRSTSSTGTYTLAASPATLTYTDTGLIAGTTYSYEIAAVNGSSAGAKSSAVSAQAP